MIFPYLTFGGCCEEALALYAKAFGGKNLHLRRYEEFAPDPAMKHQVMHAELDLGDIGHISAADGPGEEGSAVSIMVRAAEEKLWAAWAVLAEAGEIIAPLAPFAPEGGELIGTLRDKFGFTWIFTQGGE